MSLRNDKVYKAELMDHTFNALTIHMIYSSSAYLLKNFLHDSQIHTNKKNYILLSHNEFHLSFLKNLQTNSCLKQRL